MNVLGYVRVSGDGQIDKDGPPRQREVISSFCSRYNLRNVGEFFDGGVSGTVETLERPAFMEMIQAILKRREMGEAFRVDAVVVEKIDRLARTLIVAESAVKQLRKHGIKLFLAELGTMTDYATDSGDPSLNMLRQMMGVVAEFEKANMCHRLGHSRKNMRDRSGRCEGRKPYGTKPGEAEALAFAKELKAQGVKSDMIALELNAAGYRTRYGQQWSSDRIRDILRVRPKNRK